ncbi:TetR/AcrR family transcriptional regulator [Hyalangium versicolor]|uniref:TetR/AcrR family transcriptional regulator n=1 Tax=Hyalangium versicolor TaxID=2861190 RepID=UPI001CCC1921|nr:TetR family transcriptional regulator [Hyalangium versicolor]
MTQELGLRERKKLEMRRTLAATAMRLFAERGFDAVTVADIAAAVDVSVKTVFNYFPTKEDLVLSNREEIEEDLLRTVRERAPGESVLAAVRWHTLETAARIRAVPPERRVAFHKVMQSSPSVQARFRELLRSREETLARLITEETQEPTDDIAPSIVAGLLGVVGRLAFCDVTGWPDGGRRSPERISEEIHRAFDLLEKGLATYGVRSPAWEPSGQP